MQPSYVFSREPLKFKKIGFAINLVFFAALYGTTQAALVIEFNERESDMVVSYTGSLTLKVESFYDDSPIIGVRVSDTAIFGEGVSPRVSGYSGSVVINERYIGTDLYDLSIHSTGVTSSDIVGFGVSGDFVSLYQMLNSSIVADGVPNLLFISAEEGGILHNKEVVFTDYSYDMNFNLKNIETNVLIDLWRVSGTTSTDNLIQFRLNKVPEPFTSSFLAMSACFLIFRRKIDV